MSKSMKVKVSKFKDIFISLTICDFNLCFKVEVVLLLQKWIMKLDDVDSGTEADTLRRQDSTTAEEVSSFQRLFPNPSWLMSGGTSGHQNLVSIFPGIDNSETFLNSSEQFFVWSLLIFST